MLPDLDISNTLPKPRVMHSRSAVSSHSLGQGFVDGDTNARIRINVSHQPPPKSPNFPKLKSPFGLRPTNDKLPKTHQGIIFNAKGTAEEAILTHQSSLQLASIPQPITHPPPISRSKHSHQPNPTFHLSEMPSPPSAATLAAFGLQGDPSPLPGGRGLCFIITQQHHEHNQAPHNPQKTPPTTKTPVVLRPTDDIPESQFVAQLSTALLNLHLQNNPPKEYRLATPLPAVASSPTTTTAYVVNNWTASSFVSGRVSLARFPELFRAARALHRDLANLIPDNAPAAIANRASNRFDEADRVTWKEKTLDQVALVNHDMLSELQPILDRLDAAMRPLPLPEEDSRLVSQLVHMDLLGNVLFDDQGKEEGEEPLPPGIIDLTFYWRPALYAEAIVVADGLTWLENRLGRELLELFLGEEEEEAGKGVRVQLLVRALYWRYLTFAIDPDLEWVRVNLPLADYAGAADLICGLVT